MSDPQPRGERAAAVERQLAALVTAHGPSVLNDSRRVRAMLADSVTGATAEINLVGLALTSGVPARLREAAGRSGAVDDVAADLERTSSVQPADARWAVGAIAAALRLDTTGATTRDLAGDAPPAAGGLLVAHPGGTHTATGDRAVTIGRDPDNDIVLDSPAVSRTHARLDRRGSTWTYTDKGSTQGSFVDGVAITSQPVERPVRVVLGQGPDAVALDLTPAGSAPAAAGDATRLPAGRQRPAPATELAGRPGGVLGGGAPATELGGQSAEALTASVGGSTRRVGPGARLTIGREADNDLVCAASTVSRNHARIEHRTDGWHLVDLGTTSGTWHEGRRVEDVRLAGRQELVLGDAERGDRLVVVAPGQPATSAGPTATTGPRSRRWVVPLAAAGVVLALVAGIGAWAALRGGPDGSGTPAEAGAGTTAVTKDQLARATVQLESDTLRGSGVVVDAAKGLILTNAHVADPAAVGLAVQYGTLGSDQAAPDPAPLLVSVSDGLDKSAEPRFTATLVASDGYLDLAVVRIEKKLSGTPVDAEDLATLTQVTLGDSDDVGTTDTISFFGYPVAADSVAPTFTEGVVSGPVQDPRIGTAAMINTDASISGGNSGGLAADAQGRMVGIPTINRLDDRENSVFSSFRPVDLALPLIEAARNDATYTSPYVTAAPRAAKETRLSYGVPGRPGTITGSCRGGDPQQGLTTINMRYTGFPGGEHTDVVGIIGTGGRTVEASTDYPTSLPRSGCLSMTFPQQVAAGRYRLRIAVGGDLVVIYDRTITLE